MNIDTFLKHYGVNENPFLAEEAKDDPVYLRMMAQGETHPDFDKVFGSTEHPSTAVVFGNKGSGKTAMKMKILDKLNEYNESNPDKKVWVVRYDELNPFIDRMLGALNRTDASVETLSQIRLEDHHDAMLSNVVTDIVGFYNGNTNLGMTQKGAKKARLRLRKMPIQQRRDLAHLALLYDAAPKETEGRRWSRMKGLTRGRAIPLHLLGLLAFVLLVIAGVSIAWALKALPFLSMPEMIKPLYAWILGGITGFFGVISLGKWLGAQGKLGGMARKLSRQLRFVGRSPREIKRKLGALQLADLKTQPIPSDDDQDARYELTRRTIGVLEALGFTSIMVVMDRIDEPTKINGDADKMKALIWPMLNNKFLQQDQVGFKLLLPSELGEMLKEEDADFLHSLRLDKQNLTNMNWTGSSLYDLCSRRMQNCRPAFGRGGQRLAEVKLRDFFDEEVSQEHLVAWLEEVKQPRDAFKLLYRVIQEHCRSIPEDAPNYKIGKASLENALTRWREQKERFAG